jgi:hypothetical protein
MITNQAQAIEIVGGGSDKRLRPPSLPGRSPFGGSGSIKQAARWAPADSSNRPFPARPKMEHVSFNHGVEGSSPSALTMFLQ